MCFMITNTGISKSALGPAIETLAYTKEETDELLDAKANVSALSDGSVTKVGTSNVGTDMKPIKLVGGVPTAVGHDLVTIDTEQEITAKKGFTNNAATTSSAAAVKGYYGISNIDMSASFTGNRYAFKDCLVDGNGAIIAGMRAHAASVGQTVNLALISTKTDGTTKALNTFATYDRTNDVWKSTAPTPDSGAGANEVATVGYIDGYEPMVRTTGNQTIGGSKTFTNSMTINGGNIAPLNLSTTSNPECIIINANNYDVTDGVAHFLPYMVAEKDKNGVLLCRLALYSFADGRVQLNAIMRNADGTTKTVTLAEGNP